MRSDRFGHFASAVALALALGQTVQAETAPNPNIQGEVQAVPPIGTAPPAASGPGGTSEAATTVPPASPGSATPEAPAASGPNSASAEQHRAKVLAERNRRYQELRERATGIGIDLPEVPPWEQQERPQPPGIPGLAAPFPIAPAQWDNQRDKRYATLRERAAASGIVMPETPPWRIASESERQTQRDFLRNLTPQQRQTLDRLRWEELRALATERGYELPESSPWQAAERRREAMRARWESYRKTVEALTDEQREAAAAVFGGAPFARDGGEGYPEAGPGAPGQPPAMPPCGAHGFHQGHPPFGPPGNYQGPAPPYGSGY